MRKIEREKMRKRECVLERFRVNVQNTVHFDKFKASRRRLYRKLTRKNKKKKTDDR